MSIYCQCYLGNSTIIEFTGEVASDYKCRHIYASIHIGNTHMHVLCTGARAHKSTWIDAALCSLVYLSIYSMTRGYFEEPLRNIGRNTAILTSFI